MSNPLEQGNARRAPASQTTQVLPGPDNPSAIGGTVRVTINGQAHCRSCLTICEPGMEVRTDE